MISVDFPTQHPRQDVADHEVLLSFAGDAEGVAFREWWHDEGAKMFACWMTARMGEPEYDVQEEKTDG